MLQEMELIYDLKGHIERLQYEMSELRDSVKSCVGMQVNFQDTIKQEIEAAVCRSSKLRETPFYGS